MKINERFDNGLFSIRFAGEELKHRGVSIYDLSNSLLAIQRILHKAHLSIEDGLFKGAFPTSDARQGLALQLGERRRESDAFALVPILSDSTNVEYLKSLAAYVIGGLSGYYATDVIDRLRLEPDQNKRIFTGSIYKEICEIVNRVGATGGVESISIGAPVLGRPTIASFDLASKDYLAELKHHIYLGNYQEIKGSVYKLYPSSKIVAIRRSGGRSVSIFLSEENFDRIRYHRENSPLFIFRGRARYQLGVETKIISEFEADSIEYIPVEER